MREEASIWAAVFQAIGILVVGSLAFLGGMLVLAVLVEALG